MSIGRVWCGVLLSVGAVAAGDWPGFRGPAADGKADADLGAAPGLSVRYKLPLGSGYSGVAVADGRVFTAAADGAHDVVWAFDAASGKTLWRHELEATYAGHDGSHDGPIATPVVAGDVVIGLSALGKLVGLDVENGSVVWQTDLPENHGAPTPFYGFCTSPLLVDGVLTVMLGGEGAALAGFDPATGEKLWSTGTVQVAYQTPSWVRDGGRDLALAAGMDKLIAVEPRSGELVWEYEHGGNGGRGAASLTAVPGPGKSLFLAHKDDASALVRWKPNEGGAEFETVWENRAIRNSYNIAVIHDGHVYAFSSRFLTCVELETGEVKWRSRAPGDGFLTLVGEHLAVATKEGSLHLIEATPEEYREVASAPLFEDLIWSNPAFADGSVFVRGLDGLARVDVVGAATRVAAHDEHAPPAGSLFGKFLARARTSRDPGKVVDELFDSQESFPIVEPGWVHFVYRDDVDDVAIGGDLIGARQDRAMNRLEGTNLFWFSSPFPADARIDYAFIPAFGDAIPDPRNPRRHVSTMFGTDMEMARGEGLTMSWVAGPEWREIDYAAGKGPRGRRSTHKLKAEGLEEKIELTVWRPHKSRVAKDERLPTLYLLGREDVVEQGNFPDVLDHLSRKGMPPVIAVFVDIPTRDTGAFADLLVSEVVPYVDGKYPTRADRAHRTVLGQTFAGYAAVLAGLKHPEVVGRVATQSMHLLDMMFARLEPLAEGEKPADLRVVLEWSRYDTNNPHEAWDMREYNRRVVELLDGIGVEVEAHVVNEAPGWFGWRNRAGAVLRRLYPEAG